jgi:putative ABC transport system permease protein
MRQGLAQDLRYAVRRLAHNPGFSLLVVVILALGIGANSAMFSVVDGVLLRPLPFHDPDRLLQLNETESASGRFPLTGADYLDWREQNHAFADMSVYSYASDYNASANGEPERASVVETQANFFALLGVPPLRGRAFVEGEDQAGHNRVALLSYGYWQTRFAGLPDAIGKSIQLNGAAYQVVGVLPAWYRAPGQADLWIPIDASRKGLGPRGEHHLRAIGRVKTGVSVAQAEADLKAIAARLEKQFPNSNDHVGAVVTPLKENLVEYSREALWILFGAVGMVLLIACANVANLLLARSSGRRREVAVRRAMGASRSRVVQQLLTESLLVSLLGGAMGMLVAYGTVQLLASAESLPIPRVSPIGISSSVLLFTLAVSLGVGILFGLAPAFQASRISLNEDLKSGGSATATATGRGRLLRDGLVVAEIALSLTLLAGAGLLLRTFANLRNADIGVRGENVLAATITLPGEKYSSFDKQWEFFQRLVGSLESSPEVRLAALTSELPLEGGNNGYITIEGQTAQSTQNTLVESTYVTPGYFRAMGIPVIEGRDFNEADLTSAGESARKLAATVESGAMEAQSSPKPSYEVPAVISQTMARRFWPGQPATGRVFRKESVSYRIIGVVGDVRIWSLRNRPIPQAYYPFTWGYGFPGEARFQVAVQSTGTPGSATGAIRAAVRKLDPELAVANMRTIPQIVSESMTDTNYQALLLSTFAGLAMLLAALGIYGVMSYVVSQRTNEFGIRMALGAGPLAVTRMVVRQGARLAMAGSVLGVVAALGLAGTLRKMLYGVEPADAPTLGIVFALTVAICLAASAIPARRAASVDPIVALRYE